MKRTAAVFSLGSEFDPFLLAPISDDHTGMPLTVLSALARLDVDPWEEAAVLARLPEERATVKLASLLATLPAGPSARADARSIAARLIALLPRHVVAAVNAHPVTVAPRGQVVTRSPLLSYLLLYTLLVLFTLAAQWLIGPPRVPPPVTSAAAKPASGPASPPALIAPAAMAPTPPLSGQ